MHWSHDSLWAKAQVYVQRAQEEERNGALFAFWAHTALEFLARAAVAHTSPALLADARRGPDSLLYALGHTDGKEPRSLPAAEVFALCVRVVDGFSQQEMNSCLVMADRRNRELHTGEAAFEKLPLASWLAEFYRVSDILLEHQGHTLEDLFGDEDGAAARRMIDALQEQVEKRVKDLIAAARRMFENLPPSEQAARKAAAAASIRPTVSEEGAICPACSVPVRRDGERVATSETRLDEDHELVEEVVMLPTHLSCGCCGLRLSSHAELHAAGLGGQFTTTTVLDPVDFHGIEIDDYVDHSRYYPIPDGPEYEDE